MRCAPGNLSLPQSLLCRTTLLLAALLGQFGFAPLASHAADRVSVCYGSASSALLPIARDQGFFKAEGIEIDLHPYTSGKNSIQAMLDGKCDLATGAQAPVVHHSLRRKDFLIVANLAVSDDFEKIVVRSDRGVHGPADLRGRKIALPEFTTQHYLLDTYLLINGLKLQDVQRVYLHHNEVLKAFQRGEVDGLVHREPEVQKLLAEFGNKAKVLPSTSLCVSAYLLVGKRDFVQKNPAVVKRVLRALLRAEDYAKKEPAKARDIAARTYGADREEIKKIWGLHNYRVSLDQSLFLLLENMARWEIGLQTSTQRSTMPNYLDFIYLDGLKAIRPEAVTIIH